MKTSSILMAGAAIFSSAIILTNPASAIPNQVGGIGFFNPAGMHLEDFASLPATWEADAELKGDWEMWHDPTVSDTAIELLHLKNTATVFGVKAADVTLQRKDSKAYQFKIVFKPVKKGQDLKGLLKVLKTNTGVWADKADEEKETLVKGAARIALSASTDDNEVIATISSARNKVAIVAP